MKLSSEVLKASTASATVAEMERDLKAGLPRQRSDTSCLKKLTAMQELEDNEEKKRTMMKKRQRSCCAGGGDVVEHRVGYL